MDLVFGIKILLSLKMRFVFQFILLKFDVSHFLKWQLIFIACCLNRVAINILFKFA